MERSTKVDRPYALPAPPRELFTGGSAVAAVEDAACLAALRVVGLAAHVVRAAAGLASHADRLTFAMLNSHCNFPAAPVATVDSPDDLKTLLLRFQRSKLWQSWVTAWDLQPTTRRGRRVLVGRWPAIASFFVIHDGPTPAAACVSVGHASGGPYHLQPLGEWVRSLSWAPAFD